jgi:UDP-glucose-4-epimerase GalE
VERGGSEAVLVTGAAGYIGLAVAHALDRAGYRVVRYDNLSQGPDPGGPGRFVAGDVLDSERLAAVLAECGARAVIHLAGRISVSESVAEPLLYWRNNVGGALSLTEAMARAGVGAIVFSSTAAVYGEPERLPLTEDHPLRPINPYGRSKAAVERLLADLAAAGRLSYVALRYFNAAGAMEGVPGERHQPEQHLVPNVIRAALGGAPVTVFGTDYDTPDGTALRDYVHVADLAEAHVLALRHLERGGDSGPFNLANRQGHSVLEVVRAVESAAGRPVPVRYGPRRPGDPARLIGDSGRAREMLGWRPRREGLDAIVESALAWHRSEGGAG